MREANAVDPYIRINPQSHMLEPAWMWRDVLPFGLGPDPAYQSGYINIANDNPVTVSYKLPHASSLGGFEVGNPLLINEISFNEVTQTTATADLTVKMTDYGDQRQFMNYPIHIRTFAGSGQLAARLSENLFMPTRHQMSLTFQRTNASVATHRFTMFLHGKYFDTYSSNIQSHPQDYQEMLALVNKYLERRKYVFPYWMTTEGGSVLVPANQTVVVDSMVGDEGHFEATHILRAYAGGDPTAQPFEVSITNPQTRQAYMNGTIHSMHIGDALNPQPLPAKMMIPAGQIIRFTITDLSGDDNRVYLTLRGSKIRSEFKSIEQVNKELGITTPVPPQPVYPPPIQQRKK